MHANQTRRISLSLITRVYSARLLQSPMVIVVAQILCRLRATARRLLAGTIIDQTRIGAALRRCTQALQGIQRNQQSSFYLGLLLLAVVLGLQLFELHWVWLSTLQANELYKRWSGFGLLLYIAAQWYLSALRIHGKTEAAKRHYQIHKQLGILAPLVFYLHAMKLGYAYLLLFSIVYLANVAVGLCNREFVKIKNERFMYYWMIVHVALSVCTVALAIYHLFIVFYYE